MTRRHYREARLPLAEQPPDLMARLVRTGRFAPYVVYENDGEWALAGGALADVRLRDRPPGDLAQVGEELAGLPVDGWRAYGWAVFELGPALAGADPAGLGTLLHLIVPAEEVRARHGEVLVRSVDPDRLDALIRLVNAGPGAEPKPPEPLVLSLEDTGNYRAAVAAALVELRAPGPLEKVILSRRVPVAADVDLVATYLAGRRANTPARSFLLDLGGIQAAGFSPETVAEVTSDGRVTTRPLAGTRARTGHPAEDARLRAELLGDPKEIHEHAISVKLALEDIAAACNDTYVSDYLTVVPRGTVQHLASTVTGRLRPGLGPWQALAALFPAVTATGIPKAPAYPLIRDLEGGPRGLYAGAVLTCDADGTLDAALVLRTVFRRGGHCWLQAGAGIVRHSTPDREHEETCEKLRGVADHLVPVRPAGRS
ncbi:salicylate synthase [Streptomyces sp. 4F14]|uniref:salicylate synthase n=1 Tax=Streptomyces sp. 4F14 TaxID=3394380 RepID=UPI003A887000